MKIQSPTHIYKIAIIEDDPSLVELYRQKFEIEGYNVQTASNGSEGLQLIETFSPDIILLDLLMPVMSGIEMLHVLRAKPCGDEFKVIVMTNVNDNSTTSQVYREGIIDYIVKANSSPQEVYERVEKVLRSSSALKTEK